jgi:hypothetical protein
MLRTVRAGRPRTRLKQASRARGWAEVPGYPFPRRCEDRLPSTPYVALDPLPVDRQPRQGLALRSVHPRRSRSVQLVPRFPRRHHRASSPAHLTHVGALSGRGTRPRIRPVPGRQPLGGAARVSPGPVAFRRAGIGLLGHPAPAGAVRLPHGRPTESASDPIGVATLPAREIRPGWVPSILRGCGAHTAGTGNPAVAGRLTAAHPCTQVLPPPSPGLG